MILCALYGFLVLVSFASGMNASLCDPETDFVPPKPETKKMSKETEKEDEDDIETEGNNYNHPKCHICHKYQKNPLTTKHCGACNKCIDGFDHHCGWLNTRVKREELSSVSGVTGERLDADLGAVFGGRLVVSRDLGEVEKGGKKFEKFERHWRGWVRSERGNRRTEMVG